MILFHNNWDMKHEKRLQLYSSRYKQHINFPINLHNESTTKETKKFIQS